MIDFFGRVLIIIGLFLVLLGLFFLFLSRFSLFRFFGHLPGDINIKGKNFQFFFPLTSSLLLSLFLSLVFFILSRLFKK